MSEERSSMRITLTTSSLVRIIVVLLVLYFAYLIKDILAILFVSIILSNAMAPSVEWMHKRRFPRMFSISVIYALLLLLVGSIIYLIVPPIMGQFNQLLTDLPTHLDKLNEFLRHYPIYSSSHDWLAQAKAALGNASTNFQSAAGSVFSTIYSIVGGIFSLVVILVITFYMVLEQSQIRKLVWSLTPEDKQDYVMDVFNRVQRKMGLWLRGQLVLCVVIFALTYVGLLILGVKYALILALITGVTEFIPYLGPLLGAVPAVFLSLSQTPMLAVLVAILFFVIHQVENNFLAPKVMQKAVGLNPIISISALMIGFSLGGILGAVLSIPVATAATEIFEDMLHKKRASESGE